MSAWAPYVIEALTYSPFMKKVEEFFPEENYSSEEKRNQEIIDPDEKKHKIKMISTAYYKPVRNQNQYAQGSYRKDVIMNGNGITYTGVTAQIGTVAADPSVIPLGSVIYVPGYGRAIVEDIGSAIKENRIDLFMGTGEKALKRCFAWGRKPVIVTILEWGNKD